MIAGAGHGHPGGGLSVVEIMTVLYFSLMRVDPSNPSWPDRDRLVLSKGHGAAAWYSALALKGYFPLQELERFRKKGSILQGHPDMRKTPGVDMTSGSLGQGLSAALGMALAARMQKRRFQVYVLLGDGEVQEGQIWEAAMAASHFRPGNLIAILDHNRLQLDGLVSQVMPIEPLMAKWQAFGWETVECMDGHNIAHLLQAFETAQSVLDCPVMIIAHTVKGKGVSFMENEPAWHGVSDPMRLPDAVREVQKA